MAKKFDFDLIVIGSGIAGATAALAAAESKNLKIALVESGNFGGAALNSRDIPYAASLHFSGLYSAALAGARFGLGSSHLTFNYPSSKKWQLIAARRAGAGSKKPFEEAGITCYHGPAYFLAPNEISIGERHLTAAEFIIATGSIEHTGEVAGVEKIRCLTPSTALNLAKLPKAVFVVGAGSTGCEIAQYYAELGVKVLLADLSSRILPREDVEVGQILSEYFTEHHKIKVLTESRVLGVAEDKMSKIVRFLQHGQEKSVRVDTIVLATGSRPALDLGLENAGIKLSATGELKANQYMQTNVHHIYAAGSVLNARCTSDRAAYEALIAAKNIIKKNQAIANREDFIQFTNTHPSIATIGLTEDGCLKADQKYYKSFIPLSAVSASNTTDTRMGFVKLLSDRQGIIIGGTAMCPNADLVIQEIALAVNHKLNAPAVASAPHLGGSWSEMVRLAARDLSSHLKK